MVLKYLLLLFGIMFGCQESDFTTQRRDMVLDQIVARGIRDKATINAMMKVPRHEFVPLEYREYSYHDRPLPIGLGQTISQPYIVAYMTEALKLKADDKVLEIGTGSGYQAAIMGEIVEEVHTIEIVEPLGRQAAQLLESLGYLNVYVKTGDGYHGIPDEAPFDAIMVTAAPEAIPQPLLDQLAEGGRLIIPVGPSFSQYLILATKRDGKIVKRKLHPVRFVPFTREKE